MFDIVRNNKKFIQLVLAIIMLPFALWGVDSYVRTGGGDSLASVGGSAITTNEFQQALREQQERVRAQMGEKLDQALIESQEFRARVLEDLINQRLLSLHAAQDKLRVSDEALAGFITSQPTLQEDGKFSRERYQSLVAAQGMSVEMFEMRVRQDLVLQQALMAAGNASVAGRIPADRWLAAQLEQRIVSEVVIRPDQFAAESKPDVAAIQRYYEENRAKFEQPEQVRVAFVVLSQEKLASTTKIDEAAIKAQYQARQAQYMQPAQRRASHILIRVDAKATEAEVKAARDKAEQILVQVKKSPADFAKVAKQHSQDPGSADRGGDLGYFGPGMMVKPFEEAAFALAENQISDVVRSDFGLHIIKLTGIRAGRGRSLEEVREEIVDELRRQAVTKQYAEAAEGFGNIVYEQSDTLTPAAEKYGLTIQETGWIGAGGNPMPPFNNPKLLKSLFTEDALKHKRNTEAVDIGNNTLVAARIIEHRPAALQPLDAVGNVIEKALVRETALAKTKAAGEDKVKKLLQGEKVELTWGGARPLVRVQAPQLSTQARRAIFGARVSSLPTYVGAETQSGYTIYRIEGVKPYVAASGESASPADAFLRQQYGQIVAQEEMAGWMAALRQRYPVNVNKLLLERK